MVIRTILQSQKYEVQTYRMCLGILNFTKKYSNKSLEECCKQAISLNKQKYTFIKNTILVIAEDLEIAGFNHMQASKKSSAPGGYVMSLKASSIDTLLSRSKNLADQERKEESSLMLTGKALLNELVDELNELKLSHMAATLDGLYHQPGFLKMEHMTLIAELIGPEFREKVSKALTNRLRVAKLFGSPEELPQCKDSDSREYLPGGITELHSSLEFIERGYNVCILGASDAGKTCLAKAIGIQACNRFNVG